MVSRIRPLEVDLEVEDRLYRLGETIDVTVSVTARRDVDVREARVDLVCEERASRQSIRTNAPLSGEARGMSGRVEIIPEPVVEENTYAYVHSSIVFLSKSKIRSDRTETYHPKLRIEPTPPRHFEQAQAADDDAWVAWSFKWKVVATVNVVRGRNPKRQRSIRVILPAPPERPGAGSKPRMSRPKPSTGPSRKKTSG